MAIMTFFAKLVLRKHYLKSLPSIWRDCLGFRPRALPKERRRSEDIRVREVLWMKVKNFRFFKRGTLGEGTVNLSLPPWAHCLEIAPSHLWSSDIPFYPCWFLGLSSFFWLESQLHEAALLLISWLLWPQCLKRHLGLQEILIEWMNEFSFLFISLPYQEKEILQRICENLF